MVIFPRLNTNLQTIIFSLLATFAIQNISLLEKKLVMLEAMEVSIKVKDKAAVAPGHRATLDSKTFLSLHQKLFESPKDTEEEKMEYLMTQRCIMLGSNGVKSTWMMQCKRWEAKKSVELNLLFFVLAPIECTVLFFPFH